MAGGAPAVVVGLAGRCANGQRQSRCTGDVHGPVEGDPHPDRLRQPVGVAARRAAPDQRGAHPRRGLLAAVHLVACGVRDGLAAEAQRRVRGAASDSDRAAVQRKCGRGDADPIRVAVRRLHDVAEPEIAYVGAADVVRLPRHRPDGQRKLWRAGHGHRPVEGDSDPDGLRQPVGVVRRGARNQNLVHRRRGGQAAVHLVGVCTCKRVPTEPERRVRGAPGRLDRAAVQRQRTRADVESVGVAVRRLHEIDEPKRGSAGLPVETRLPGGRADRQRQLRRAGDVHGLVEGHADGNRLGQAEGAAARRCAVQAHAADGGLAPPADRREGGEQAGGNGDLSGPTELQLGFLSSSRARAGAAYR